MLSAIRATAKGDRVKYRPIQPNTMIKFTGNIGCCLLNNEHYEATILTFDIEGGICEPSDLASLELPNVAGELGLVISGRGPVWLYAALAHHYHVTAWVATFDPRVGGAVVVSTHSRNAPPVGSVVALPKLAPQ